MAPDACANCGILGESVGVKLNSYSRYKAVKYCGKACQLRHWKERGHKKTCPSGFSCGLGRRSARYLANGEVIWHANLLRQDGKLEALRALIR